MGMTIHRPGKMKGAGFLAIATALAVIASVVAIPLPTMAADSPVGSQWVYSFQDRYFGETYSGTWTQYCDRIVAAPMGDHVDSYEYHSILTATGSGTSSGISYNGTIATSEVVYYEVGTYDTIGFISEQHTSFRYNYGGGSQTYTYDIRNETTFTPPGGIGSEPTSLQVGDSWTKTYTKVFNTSGYYNGNYTSLNSTEVETLEFTYDSSESISVPAGDFNCEKIIVYYQDGTVETDWYSTEISEYVKMQFVYSSGETVLYKMTSYSTGTNGGGGGTVEMGSDLFIAGFFIFIGATIVAAALAYRIVEAKKDLEENRKNPFGPPGPFP